MQQEPLVAGKLEKIIEDARKSGGLVVSLLHNRSIGEETHTIHHGNQSRGVSDSSPLGKASSEICEWVSKTCRKSVNPRYGRLPIQKAFIHAKREAYASKGERAICDVCGDDILEGDVFVSIDLADYGYSRHTSKVCLSCKEEIENRAFG